MTVQKTEQFSKRVEFKAVDADKQIATGGVFVPNKVDLQGDYARPALIREWSADFMRRLQDSEASAEGGVMHVAFPGDHVSLVENTVLEEDREIGGKQFPAGSWIQSWQFHDDELWSLVEDNILQGYSIGATDVTWDDPVDQDDLPEDVTVAADYPDDEPAREILGGTIHEVSSVDIPAVPDAEMVSFKSNDFAKALPASKEEFVAEMQERGHAEEDAERLYRYLQRATGESLAAADDDDAGGEGWLARAKAYFSGDTSARKADGDAPTCWVCGDEATYQNGDPPHELLCDDHAAPRGDRVVELSADTADARKESRTLSRSNRERLMAAHDAVEDALASDVEFSTNRFTDNPTVDFDVADYGKAAPSSGGDEGDTDPSKDTMTESPDDDPMKDAPEWAKALHEEQQKNSDAIADLREKDGGNGDGDDPEAGKSLEDAPEWAKAIAERTEKNAEHIEEVAKASGQSQQLDGGESPESKTSKADVLGLPGGDN
jgi:hypothetical protein